MGAIKQLAVNDASVGDFSDGKTHINGSQVRACPIFSAAMCSGTLFQVWHQTYHARPGQLNP